MTALLTACALSQGYRRNTVFSGLDLSLAAGITALLGPNGAGKTTLIRTLATTVPPLSGRLHFGGQPIDSRTSLRDYRRDIGYLAQDFGYYPGFSVADFVSYSAWARGLPSADIPHATADALRRVDLATRGRAKMRTLSGGMLQRAGVAAAIVGLPRVILLDEPTVGLDPAQRLHFRAMLNELSDSAVLLSTHLIEDVAAMCDRVIILTAGRVVFEGSVEDLSDQADESVAPGGSRLEAAYMTVLRKVAAI